MDIIIELPDFDKFYVLNNTILELTLQLESLKLHLEKTEADTVAKVFSDVKTYNVNGKQPSMEYVKNTWKVTGIGEVNLMDLRKAVYEAQAKLDCAKREYEILKITVETWRTQSANERSSFS